MRAFSIWFPLLFSLKLFSQQLPNVQIPYDSLSQRYQYQGVIADADNNAESLYHNARNYLKSKNPRATYHEEIPNEQLMATLSILSDVYIGGDNKIRVPRTINFLLQIDFKENRFRYTISGIKISGNEAGTTYEVSLESFVRPTYIEGATLSTRKKVEKESIKNIENTTNELHVKFTEFIEHLANGIRQSEKRDW